MKNWVSFLFLLFTGILNAQKPELVIERDGHTDEAVLVCFSPDERQALSAGWDNRLMLWDLDSKKFVRFIRTETTPKVLCFGLDGQSAIALLEDNSLNRWNLENGQLLWRVQSDSSSSSQCQGDSLLLFHPDSTISCWDIMAGTMRWRMPYQPAWFQSKTPTPGLVEKLITLGNLTINKVDYSRDGQIAVCALGNPTIVAMTTPGQPLKRHGFGALLVWNLLADSLAYPMVELPEMLNEVVLSHDGRRCLSASSDGTVLLWDLTNGSIISRMERELSYETMFTFSSDFHRFAVSRLDNTLKIVNQDQRNSLVTKRTGYEEVNTFCFSPDHKDLFVADRRGSIIRLSGTTLDSVLAFLPDQHMEVIHDLAVSADGKRLLAGSSKEPRVMFRNVDKTNKNDIIDFIRNEEKEIIGFETPRGKVYGRPIDSPFGDDSDPAFIYYSPNVNVTTIWDLEKGQLEQVLYPYNYEGWVYDQQLFFSPDGRYAMAKVEGNWTAWDTRSGNLVQNKKGHLIFHAVHFDDNGGHALSMLPDGKINYWNLQTGGIEQTNDRFRKTIATAFNPSGEKGLALGENGKLTEWDLQTGEITRQIFISKTFEVAEIQYTPVEDIVIIRSDGQVILLDLASGKSLLEIGHEPTEAFAGDQFWDGHGPLQVSLFEFLPDGRTAVSARYNGTLQYWDIQTGKEICTMLMMGEKDWVVSTPGGLFDASEGAMRNMYFRLGTEVLELEQLKDRYFEPGILQKLLGFAPGGLRPVDVLADVALYPKIINAAIETDKIKVRLKAREGGIGKVSLFLNDKIELEPNVNPDFVAEFVVNLLPYEQYFFPDSLNRLSLRAYNQDEWLKGPPYILSYNPVGAKGKPLTSLSKKRDVALEEIKLYALVVGTSNFRGSKLNLRYPDKDATAFAEALRLSGTPLFGENMEIKLLTTSADPYPRKAEIAKALADFAEKSNPNDILLLYFSGHGITYPDNSEKGQFYYLTTDILDDKLDDPITRNTLAIGQDTLQKWIRNVKALKRILILDACNSGKVVQSLEPGQKALNSDQRRALERMNDRSGMFVLAGSAADKVSFEASRYGHGLLTYSLLNNMPFIAASNKTYIDIAKLFNSALEEVPRLAMDIGKVQQPELIAVESFDIGILDPDNPFPIPQALPVFVRTVFMNQEQNKDLQRLSKAVNSYLGQLAGDNEPAMVYWDIDEFAGEHYYLGGLYQVTGNEMNGSATLYRRDKLLASFPFSGSIHTLEEVAEQIITMAFEKLKTSN